MRTTIYGYIEEMDFWNDPVRTKVFVHNRGILNLLPQEDVWPPLSKGMFAICDNVIDRQGTNLEYRGRIMHFGANLKSVELDWKEWRLKFEDLLTRLFFLEAVVHFKPEYSSIQTNEWSVNLLSYQIKHDNTMPYPITKQDWTYESTWEK